jgi:tetratricopeptide (TPR) repeat protein
MAERGHFHQELTPEQDIRLAQQAFNQGELAQAIFHLSYALSSDPQNQEWLALLEQIITHADNPLKLISLEESNFALVATKAYILARLGDYDTAIYWLVRVLKVISNLSYLPWIVKWLSIPGVVDITESDTIVMLFSVLLAKMSEEEIENPITRNCIESLLPILEELYQGESEKELVAFFLASILRKLNRIDEAFKVAHKTYNAYPSWRTAVSVALVYRTRGEIEQAIAFYQQALQHEPTDLSARLDMADLLCSHGRLEEGISYYQQVLAIEPEHPWAYPHYLYYQFFLQRNLSWKEKLQKYAAIAPDNQEAVSLAQELEELFTPYVGYLPPPEGEIVKMLSKWDKSAIKPDYEDLTALSLNAIESPSSRLAMDIYLKEQFGKNDLTVEVQQIQTPDPRIARSSVDYLLWEYQENNPKRSISPPSTQVSELIAYLASRHYYLPDWLKETRLIASRLDSDKLVELLGVMVHPPQRPPEIKIWDWIQRVQVAAAFTIAYLDEGWHNSLRKRVLFSLLLGPMDWTVEAAVVALTQIALEEESAAPEILHLFINLLNSVPKPGYCPYEYALVCCSLRFPCLHEEFRTYLLKYKQDLEGEFNK